MFIKKIAAAASILSTMLLTTGCSNDSKPLRDAKEQPNIIVIYLDDAGYGDVKAFNQNSEFETPNLDQLANEGQKWTNFYTTEPVCTPSRAALLTGRLSVRNGTYGPLTSAAAPYDTTGLPHEEYTIAEALRDVGYNTAMLGKWHIGSTQEFYPTRHGFDYYYGNLLSNDYYEDVALFRSLDLANASASITESFAAQDFETVFASFQELSEIFSWRQALTVDPKQAYWNVPILDSYTNEEGEFVDSFSIMQQAGFTQELNNKAKRYIADNKNTPFFLYLAYPQNHVPLFVSPKFKGTTSSDYGDVMTEIDDAVSQVMAAVESNGIANNTIVIFASDNGPWLEQTYVQAGHAGSTGGLRGAKQASFDGGVKSPTIIHWPGQITPAEVEGIGSTLDILPTLANLSGASLPAEITFDGVDLSPTLLNGATSPRKVMPYYLRGQLDAYRSGDWKVQIMQPSLPGQLPMPVPGAPIWTPTLYNLAEDPYETNDLATVYPEVLEQLLLEVDEYKSNVLQVPPLFN